MTNGIPAAPKIYHIVHVDRLASIINDGFLWSDSEVLRRQSPGTQIGMTKIKTRRLSLNKLTSHPDLYVGQCVPFYFCPRSVMLFLLSRGNHPEISYSEGQDPIIHLVSDLYTSVTWATQNNLQWAFTLSNAGSEYFEDRSDLAQLDEINWNAVGQRDWRESHVKEGKQAEFLIENHFPWGLVENIGVNTNQTHQQVMQLLNTAGHQPQVNIKREWYY